MMGLAPGEMCEARCVLVQAGNESLCLQIVLVLLSCLSCYFDQNSVSYAFNSNVWAPGLFSSTDETQPTDRAVLIFQY